MTAVTIGPAFAMLQNVAYALPARLVSVMALVTIQASIDNSTWADIANSTTGANVTALFVRCATGDTTMVAKV